MVSFKFPTFFATSVTSNRETGPKSPGDSIRIARTVENHLHVIDSLESRWMTNAMPGRSAPWIARKRISRLREANVNRLPVSPAAVSGAKLRILAGEAKILDLGPTKGGRQSVVPWASLDPISRIPPRISTIRPRVRAERPWKRGWDRACAVHTQTHTHRIGSLGRSAEFLIR